MTSRLERLYVLLESGSSASTRRAAAEQLGNVQKLHPHELYTLLDRLRVYIHSESWECRVATGLAVEAILKNVPLWTPPCVLAEDCSTGGGIPSRKVPDRVQFSLETFAIETVLSVGPLLTSGQEVGVAEPGQDMEQQRILIHKQLGLDPSTQFGNTSEIVSAEDLTIESPSTPVDEPPSLHQNSNGDGKCKMGTANYTVVSEPDSSQCAHKQHRKRLQPDHGDDSEKVSASKKIKQAEIKPGAYTRPLSSYLSCENWQECVEWPLEGFCEMLLDDLSSCHWIIRHGAAIALRYTLVVHGSGAGKVLGLTKQQMEQQHVRRLEDIALRIIRVLLLDRFADYVGDQVIAPVRESAAQALVAVFHLISPDASTSTNSNVLPSSLHSTTRCSPGAKLSSSITDSCTSHESLSSGAKSSSSITDSCTSHEFLPLRIISGGRSLIERLVALLVSLATFQGDQWQIRHAAQLTFKYLLPVRLEQQGRHLSVDEVNMNDHNVNARLVNTVLTGLDDSHDDVVAVAASTVCHCDDLLLNQHVHHQLISSERLQLLSCRLWRELLPALDDLMTCTPAVVQLLASMVTRNVDIPQCSVSGLVECLWPFLCHVSSSVRYAATQAMLALVKCRSVSEWKIDTVQSTLRLTMQCTLTENHQPTVKILGELWKCMLSRCPLATLLTCVCPLVASWLCMLMQPARVPYTSSLLFHPAPSQRGQQRIDRSPQLPPPSSASAAESAAAPVAAVTTTYQAAYLGGPGVIAACSWDGGGDGDRLVVGARLSGCRLMGWLSPYIVQPMPGATYTEETSPISTYMALLASHLLSRSYLQRFVVGHIVAVWMQTCGEKREDELSAGSTDYNHSDCANTPTAVPSALIDKLLSCCSEQLCYDETAVMFARLQRDCRDYIAQLKHYKLNNSSLEQLESVRVLSFEQIDRLVGPVSDTLIEPQLPRLQVKVQRSLQERRVSVRSTSRQVSSDQACCSSRTQVATVCAVIASRSLPEKLTALVRPLIDCLKREPNEELQALAAGCLVTLIQFVSHRHNNPVDKILRNLCSFVCCDPNFTPQVDGSREQICGPAGSCSTSSGGLPPTPIHAENSQLCSIITWDKMQQAATDHAAARTSSANSTDSSSTVSSDLALLSSMTFTGSASKSADDDLMYVQRRGATMALVRMFGRFSCSPDSRPSDGPRAFASLSVDLVQRTLAVLDAPAEDFSPLNSHSEKQRRRETVQRLVNALQVVELLVPHLSDSLLQQVMSYLPHLRECLQHDYSGVRHMSSRCISALTRLKTHTTLAFFCQHILPMLEDPVSVNCRRGASECLACVLQCTSTSLSALSYLPLLTLPVLARMSDHDSSVRSLCAHLFGQLVQLMPLQQQQPRTDGDQEGMPQHLRLASERHRAFIERLMSPDAIADQPLTVRLRGAQLRPYQRRGVSWLQFLAQYRLHGILCDDMGLGKSLQTLCVLAATAAPPPDAHHSQTLSDSTPDSLSSVVLTANHLPSLIVCPPTLTGHWMFEVERFMEPGVLIPLQYFGLPSERRSLQHQLTNVNLVISSYDIVRNDLDFFSAVKWNYCVLDEGHMIRNGRTKLARAIKQLHACHRLILTGTPMQNSVLELWSLFDFLMPGFLGSERQFNARYSRPILLSRGARANSREEEAGALALESLHRQVLPFMLRRLKEDVLDDLPPKIMQDYRCRLSDIQRVLYEDFARSRAQTTLVAGIEQQQQQQQHPAGGFDKKTHTHVFQALQYLRKVCNHPKLVLTPEHPSYAAVMARIGHKSSALNSIEHSGKLTALHQLLIDLGMGGSAGSGQAEEQNISCSVPSVNRHRALIFCQLKSMLDIVEHDLLERHLPTVSYLRLDGSVPAGERHQLVQRFNSDVTCDLLLLTTQVGGLGLNLTGADTVIFVEHDWNPMKDLQAMDRVHRIGQKRVVNVYRLIAERTLEEKIMGLQKFKLMTANSVVTTDNSSLLTMGTAQLFDLFTLDDRSAGVSADSASRSRDHDSSHVKGVQAMLQALPELWDDHEYQREYDLSAFLHTLRS